MGRAEYLFEDIKSRGLVAIDDFIANAATEEYFLDFKISVDQGSSKDLYNFAKAISGFGNSEGGVIVWGVDCSKNKDGDYAKTKMPIDDAKKFKTRLDGTVSGRTMPAHTTVESIAVLEEGASNRGYVVTLIPKSNFAPHQVLDDRKYFMRYGSSFDGVPHGILQGMFGHRPEANLKLVFRVINCSKFTRGSSSINAKIGFRFSVRMELENKGPGFAENVFLSTEFLDIDVAHPDRPIHLDRHSDKWNYVHEFWYKISAMLKKEIYLPPQATLCPVVINFSFDDPAEQNLSFQTYFGSAGTQTHSVNVMVNAEKINGIFHALKTGAREEDLPKLIGLLFELPH